MRIRRSAGLLVSMALLVTGGAVMAEWEFGTTGSSERLLAASVPSAAAARSPGSPGEAVWSPPGGPGVPVRVEIPMATSQHPTGVTAPVSSHPLTASGALFVPPDPAELSWSEVDAAPAADHGSAIITGHVNYVVNGRLVVGALSDLAEYGSRGVGQIVMVDLADGRRLRYRIVGGASYNKDELAARPDLRQTLFDQDSTFGTTRPSGRLVLVSCGGPYDNSTGSYRDNVFLFALPVS
jgi:hypothetical protein